MNIDVKILKLFIQNLDEAYRSLKLIILSYPRLRSFFPLHGDHLKNLDIDDLDKLDAFRVRFCDLQDAIGHKLFRSLLLLEMEPIGSNLDIINNMEKRKIIASFQRWQDIRNIRNLFIHDYLDTIEFRAKLLNDAFNKTEELIVIMNRIIEYASSVLKIDLENYKKLHLKE